MKEYSKAVKKADMILYTIVIFLGININMGIFCFTGGSHIWSRQNYCVIKNSNHSKSRGGIIDDIFVKSGDIVSKDEALIQLNTTRFVSELSALEKKKQPQKRI